MARLQLLAEQEGNDPAARMMPEVQVGCPSPTG
jgi:hypothetical protein